MWSGNRDRRFADTDTVRCKLPFLSDLTVRLRFEWMPLHCTPWIHGFAIYNP